MPARKKSGKITLRMDPDIHARVAKTAKALGMDINGLLNWIIRMHLPDYEARARWVGDPKLQRMRRWVDELICTVAAEWVERSKDRDVESKIRIGNGGTDGEPVEKPEDMDVMAFEKTGDWRTAYTELFLRSSDEGKQMLLSTLKAVTGLAEALGKKRRAEPEAKPEDRDVAVIEKAERSSDEGNQTQPSPQSLDETATKG